MLGKNSESKTRFEPMVSQPFRAEMLLVPLRGKKSRIWYNLGTRGENLHLHTVQYLLGLPQYHIKVFDAIIFSFFKLNEILSACTYAFDM